MVQVCVCGGGNATHVLAATVSTSNKHQLTLFANYEDEAERISAKLKDCSNQICMLQHGKVTSTGTVCKVSKNPEDVIPSADVIIIPVPSFAHRNILSAIAPHVKKDAILVAFPGQGGFQWIAKEYLGDIPCTIAGINQLPYQCRILEYGSTVDLIGHKTRVSLGCIPSCKAAQVCELLEDIIQLTKLSPLSSYLSITLTPANQVIHPSIMYGLFHSWTEGEIYEKKPLFYQNTDDFTADIMKKASHEIVSVARSLNLSEVPEVDEMMRQFYGDNLKDPSTIKSIFCTNIGYVGLTAPMKEVEGGGYVPDFHYRYLSEDIPNGLCLVKEIASLLDKATPTIDMLICWAQEHLGKSYMSSTGQLNGKDAHTLISIQQSQLDYSL